MDSKHWTAYVKRYRLLLCFIIGLVYFGLAIWKNHGQ